VSNEVAYALIGATVLVIALVLVFWSVRRNIGVRMTRLGVFIERELFDKEPDREPEQPPEVTDTWPVDKHP
jgi:hypothetical protein